MLSKIDITEVKSSFRFRVKSFPGDFVNRSLFRAISWMVVFNSFFSFAACELIVHPPCNEPGSLFNTRAVFSNALLKTAALFCPFVKLFLLFSQKKYPAPSLGTRYLSCHLILMTLPQRGGCLFLELLGRFELPTSSLPRMRSTY